MLSQGLSHISPVHPPVQYGPVCSSCITIVPFESDSNNSMLGNMKQIAQRNAWGFLDDLVHTYGPVSKIHGFFGVSRFAAALA